MLLKKQVFSYTLLFVAGISALAAVVFLFFKENGVSRNGKIFFEPTPSPYAQGEKTKKEQPELAEYALVGESEDAADFLKKEELAEGLTLYYLDSGDANRPDLLITKGQGEEKRMFFSRTTVGKTRTVRVSYYTSADGQPEKIIKGSSYYGQDKEIYLYPSLGESIITDPSTGMVLEEASFPSTTINKYLEKFGKFL